MTDFPGREQYETDFIFLLAALTGLRLGYPAIMTEGSSPRRPFLASHPQGVTLSLKVSPNATKTRAQGLWQGKLRLRVQAPPVDGKANDAIRKWAASAFGLRRRAVTILSGDKSSEKLLLLEGADIEAVGAVLDGMIEDH